MIFTPVPESQFGEYQLQLHGVWARYDHPSEIEEIVSWGVDRSEIMAALAATDSGSDHAMYPVLQTDPLPEYLDIYVRAEFETPDNQRLTGYVSGKEGFVAFYYANDEFSFSAITPTHFPDINLEELSRFRNAIGDPDAVLFPMKFRTAYRKPDGTPLCGSFTPAWN